MNNHEFAQPFEIVKFFKATPETQRSKVDNEFVQQKPNEPLSSVFKAVENDGVWEYILAVNQPGSSPTTVDRVNLTQTKGCHTLGDWPSLMTMYGDLEPHFVLVFIVAHRQNNVIKNEWQLQLRDFDELARLRALIEPHIHDINPNYQHYFPTPITHENPLTIPVTTPPSLTATPSIIWKDLHPRLQELPPKKLTPRLQHIMRNPTYTHLLNQHTTQKFPNFQTWRVPPSKLLHVWYGSQGPFESNISWCRLPYRCNKTSPGSPVGNVELMAGARKFHHVRDVCDMEDSDAAYDACGMKKAFAGSKVYPELLSMYSPKAALHLSLSMTFVQGPTTSAGAQMLSKKFVVLGIDFQPQGRITKLFWLQSAMAVDPTTDPMTSSVPVSWPMLVLNETNETMFCWTSCCFVHYSVLICSLFQAYHPLQAGLAAFLNENPKMKELLSGPFYLEDFLVESKLLNSLIAGSFFKPTTP
ncbi:hypothetical protein PSHT_12286, partial [Puccinia striiformis]